MFDFSTDNQLKTAIAGLAAGALLLTGVATVAAAELADTASAQALNGAERRALQREVRRDAARERAAEQRSAAQSATVAGVPRATLEAIAACESGGDPTAVNPAGYYGKYQFSIGTWQAVGGSGNPAEASEAEQDRRAAILYNRSGPGQWPVCGA